MSFLNNSIAASFELGSKPVVEILKNQLGLRPFPLLFVTISGAHLYGFASEDSDYDLRGIHQLPLENIVGLSTGPETLENSGIYQGTEIDFVTHDTEKYFRMLLKKNGYVLEQIVSPFVLHSTPAFEELRTIAVKCVTKWHAMHYLGFAESEWKLFLKKRKVKPLLYVYRTMLTGIHLMKTGTLEPNLIKLNEEFKLSYVADLIKMKAEGKENEEFKTNTNFAEAEYRRLENVLRDAQEKTHLPDGVSRDVTNQLNDLLIKIRIHGSGLQTASSSVT